MLTVTDIFAGAGGSSTPGTDRLTVERQDGGVESCTPQLEH